MTQTQDTFYIMQSDIYRLLDEIQDEVARMGSYQAGEPENRSYARKLSRISFLLSNTLNLLQA